MYISFYGILTEKYNYSIILVIKRLFQFKFMKSQFQNQK